MFDPTLLATFVTVAKARSFTEAGRQGCVSLMERLWPAVEDIDTSSSALGGAIHRTLDELIPILISAPADVKMRRAWLERLYRAVMDDGVQYLSPVEDRWGEIAVYPELMAEYAERLRALIRRVWVDEPPGGHVSGRMRSGSNEAGLIAVLLVIVWEPEGRPLGPGGSEVKHGLLDRLLERGLHCLHIPLGEFVVLLIREVPDQGDRIDRLDHSIFGEFGKGPAPVLGTLAGLALVAHLFSIGLFPRTSLFVKI
jgi:hypothetical protein